MSVLKIVVTDQTQTRVTFWNASWSNDLEFVGDAMISVVNHEYLAEYWYQYLQELDRNFAELKAMIGFQTIPAIFSFIMSDIFGRTILGILWQSF
jgi:hypothetical protein